MHRLLERQLGRYFSKSFTIPKEWRGFIYAVNAVYLEAVAADGASGLSPSGPTETAPAPHDK